LSTPPSTFSPPDHDQITHVPICSLFQETDTSAHNMEEF